jgi:hypothetical protein
MMRKIRLKIDCRRRKCGLCRHLEFVDNGIMACGLFGGFLRKSQDPHRCRQCLAAEVKEECGRTSKHANG